MFAETIAGRLSSYHGCGKSLAKGYDNVIQYFNELHRQSIEIFSNLTHEELKKKCMTPGNVEITVWKWLRTMVEHEIHHRYLD
ncbi:MAG: DinB family protein [Ginsengibacter sp.]